MKKIILMSCIIITNLLSITNLEVAKKADEAISGFESSISQTKMILINASGQKSIREMLFKTLEGEDEDKTLSTFLSPKDIKGTKLLGFEHIDKSDDQWLYLPALKRVKRIASRNKSGSFMGSEFSYEDIGNQNYKKYTFKGDAKIVKIDGKEYYKSERIPKDKYSGYTKQIVYTNTKTFLVEKIEYFDRKSEHLKTVIFSDYKKIDGVYRVGKMDMKNHQNDKQTILIWLKDDIKSSLTNKDFNKRMLKK